MAYEVDRTANRYRNFADAITRYEWLTRPGEPAGNGRCYCGSGKKYKQCHGANGDEQRRATAIRRH